MTNNAGQRLTDEEVREYAAYHNARVTPPAKFDGLVIENTRASGPVYRWQTEEEAKAGEEAAATAERARLAADEETARVRQEAASRGVALPPVPPPPVPPPPPPPGDAAKQDKKG
jgi:hypothetical protein